MQSLPPESIEFVARHLVASGRHVDTDPETSWQHAVAAQRRGGRLAVVREATAIAAYASGRFREALAEFRTVRRMTGEDSHLPLMADCERGLGRPERALDLVASAATAKLDAATRVELLIVAAGARRDLGQHEAAVVTLQVPQLRADARSPWRARLWYAYADALAAVGRDEEARRWMADAAAADTEGETDAAERVAEMDGVLLEVEFLDDELAPEGPEDTAVQDDSEESDDPDTEGVEDTGGTDTSEVEGTDEVDGEER